MEHTTTTQTTGDTPTIDLIAEALRRYEHTHLDAQRYLDWAASGGEPDDDCIEDCTCPAPADVDTCLALGAAGATLAQAASNTLLALSTLRAARIATGD